MKRLQFFITLLFCLVPYVWGLGTKDDMRFSHIGQEEGLSHSTVFSIAQDREGYLWFATYDGVNKYDGYNFTVYRHRYADSCSVSSDISRCVTVDGEGRVWIGTREGLSLHNGRQDTFSNFSYKKDGQNLSVTHIVEIGKDRLLLSTSGGILLFDAARKRFSDDDLPAALRGLYSTALTRHGEDVYIGTTDGLYIYKVSGKSLKKLVSTPSGVRIQDMLCSVGNKMWIATGGDGLYLYDIRTGALKKYHSRNGGQGELNSNYVRCLSFDSENRLWIGSYGGLNIYREHTDDFLSVKSSELQDGSLSQNSIRDIFKDSQGGMWIGTYWGGVNYYHPYSNRFRRIKHIPLVNSLKGDVVCCISEDANSDLWIGTSDGGLNFYDHVSRQYKSYSLNADNLNVPFRDIKTIYVDDRQGKVYVGAHAGGMMVLARKTGRVEYYNRKNSNLPSNNIYSIIPDGNGGFWVAALEHLLHFDVAKRNFTTVYEGEGKSRMQQNNVLFRDSRNRVWAGGEKGVAIFNQVGNTLLPTPGLRLSPELKHSFVCCFCESSAGTVWIGTRNGLFGITNSGDTLRYTTANGLPSNVVCGVLEDAYGRLWISSNQGLSCLNPKEGKIRNFTVRDGLQGNQFNVGSYCRRSNGDMLFGGINGMTSFHPETLADNPFAPKPIIDKLFVYNKEVLPNDETGILKEDVSYTKGITLSASQNSFALQFVVTNYIAGKSNTFAYKLDGYDKSWYEQSSISPVVYSNLPAGDYTFYVKAANNDGLWNEEPAVLHIRVLPVWYCTWWAISLFVLFVAVAAGGVLRFFWLRNRMQTEIRMERMDKEKQEELSQMKIRFYVNISHELRTPLTLIISPLQELLDKVSGHWEHEQLLYIQRNAKRLLHLVNQLMDFRRAELGIFELRVAQSNAYRRVQNCFANYEKLAKRKDIDYNFYTDLQDKTELFDENYLDLIANNLLSNAFKYTDSGESITVNLFMDNGFLVLQVSDTGVGIPKDKQAKIFDRFYQVESGKEGSGVGLSLVRRLVELHHGRIDLQSEVGKGSTFSIYLPQDKNVYAPNELWDEHGNDSERPAYSTNARDAYVGEDYEEEEENSAGGKNAGKRGTVLVVEDNKELRKYLVSGLSDTFNLYEAEDGQKALDILKEQEIDVIITDVMMPVMDGVKLCKQVKQNLRTCHIPVYMLSAKTDVEYQLEGLQVGADDYMAKPFSMEVLKGKIGNMLRTRKRIFERYSVATEVEPEKLANNAIDEELLRKAIAVVEKNMDNVEFSTEQFASEMNMSRSNLHLKLKAITGKSAIDFIHKIRFGRACQLLKEGKYTVSEISFMVGYNTPSYFTARFKKYVGCLPTEYGKNNDVAK